LPEKNLLLHILPFDSASEWSRENDKGSKVERIQHVVSQSKASNSTPPGDKTTTLVQTYERARTCEAVEGVVRLARCNVREQDPIKQTRSHNKTIDHRVHSNSRQLSGLRGRSPFRARSGRVARQEWCRPLPNLCSEPPKHATLAPPAHIVHIQAFSKGFRNAGCSQAAQLNQNSTRSEQVMVVSHNLVCRERAHAGEWEMSRDECAW